MTTPSTSSEKKKAPKKKSIYFDENAPKRPRTAYILFANARRKELGEAGEHELLHQRNLIVDIAKQWKNLTDEQKKPYLDEAAREHAIYKKAMEEYKKTEAYSQFEIKKELLKQQMQQLKGHKSGAAKSSDSEGENEGETAKLGDIPIFSKEFLAYNKAQESKCKKLRQMVSALQEEKDLLKADISRLFNRTELLRGHRETAQWATKIKQRWAKLLVDALAYVSVDGEYPTLQNIDAYMQKLKKLVNENPGSKDLIAVRMALSEVNFT